jgi:hypothetical protein
MPEAFRALVIDPSQCSIIAVQTDGGLESLRALVAAPAGLDYFRIADHESSWDYGWCDELALARGKPVPAFLLSSHKDPIGGRCVLIGATKEGGDTCDAKFPIDVLLHTVTWLGVILPEVTWDKHEGVERAIVTYARVKA